MGTVISFYSYCGITLVVQAVTRNGEETAESHILAVVLADKPPRIVGGDVALTRQGAIETGSDHRNGSARCTSDLRRDGLLVRDCARHARP